MQEEEEDKFLVVAFKTLLEFFILVDFQWFCCYCMAWGFFFLIHIGQEWIMGPYLANTVDCFQPYV